MLPSVALGAPASATTKGAKGVEVPTDSPSYTWDGTSFDVALSITTDAPANKKQYSLLFDGPGVCSLSGSTLHVTGAGECVVRGRVNSGNGFDANIDDMDVVIAKGSQTITALVDGTTGWTAGPAFSRYTDPNTELDLSISGSESTGETSWKVVHGDCTIGIEVVEITGAGNKDCMIRARVAGDDNWNTDYDNVRIDLGKAFNNVTAQANGYDHTIGFVTDVFNLSLDNAEGLGAVAINKKFGDCTIDAGAETATLISLTDCEIKLTKQSDGYYAYGWDKILIKSKQREVITALADGTDGTAAVNGDDVVLDISGDLGTGDTIYSKVSGDCTVDSATATATITGGDVDCVVKAIKRSRGDYLKGSDEVTITVGPAGQTITALADGTDGTVAANGDVVDLSISGASGTGAVTYAYVEGDCTVDSGAATATITGGDVDCVVEATIAADDDYTSDSDEVTITVAGLPTTSAAPLIERDGLAVEVSNIGTWSGNGGSLGAASYQWYQCRTSHAAQNASGTLSVPNGCKLIVGATTSPWTMIGIQRRYLRVVVIRSNEAGAAYAWSATLRRK